MQSAPLPDDEKERLEALLRYEVLDTEDEKAFDSLTELASAICGTPISLVSLIDQDRQWFKSRVGLEATETPRSIAFCSHAILQEHVFEIPNALQDPRFFDNPLVTGNPDIRFYAGAPLVTPHGKSLGTLCVIDTVPKELTDEQRRALQILSEQVVSQLELRLHNHRLERINSEREKLFAIVAHDLREPFNSILGFTKRLSNKADSLDPSAIASVTQKILGSALRFYQLLDELLQWSQNKLGAIDSNIVKTSLRPVVEEGVEFLRDAISLKEIRLINAVPENVGALMDPTLTKTVIRNLVANSIKFSPDGGIIEISAEVKNAVVEVAVRDEGRGIPEKAKGRLFTSIVESHEGESGEIGHGLGLHLCGEFVRLQKGAIWVDDAYEHGARIVFSLPV